MLYIFYILLYIFNDILFVILKFVLYIGWYISVLLKVFFRIGSGLFFLNKLFIMIKIIFIILMYKCIKYLESFDNIVVCN